LLRQSDKFEFDHEYRSIRNVDIGDIRQCVIDIFNKRSEAVDSTHDNLWGSKAVSRPREDLQRLFDPTCEITSSVTVLTNSSTDHTERDSDTHVDSDAFD
jgi:hypothetical protein